MIGGTTLPRIINIPSGAPTILCRWAKYRGKLIYRRNWYFISCTPAHMKLYLLWNLWFCHVSLPCLVILTVCHSWTATSLLDDPLGHSCYASLPAESIGEPRVF